MKTQISRNNYRSEKRYSGVYQQQGRMVVDADVNEQTDIAKKRLDHALKDIIDSGIPETGGMDIVSDGEGGIEIVPGHLYVDGIPAEIVAEEGVATIAYSSQADFPDPPPIVAEIQSPPESPPGPDTVYTVYADVWERTVLAIEDGELIDPGLHGADTCTRTQTMVQIKWCPANRNPEDITYNPQRGNARLTLNLRDMTTAEDPCDPCAEQVDLDSGSGNYLFRVEVHDVGQDSNGNRTLALKWSSENGAEQYCVSNVPVDFTSGQWLYEFYNETAEKHLGWHLVDAPGFPERGVLTTDFTTGPDAVTHPYVRRWDGCLTLVRVAGQWSLASDADGGLGIDKSIALTETSDPVSRLGDVNVDDELVVNLSGLQLTLGLNEGGFDNVFVPGDFWQAPVREQDATLSPPELLMDAEEPHGIVHHYMLLADVDGNTVIKPEDLGCNRYTFPLLTNLTASRICFDNVCPELYGPDAGNVQDALANLCSRLDASDVSYEDPVCPPDAPSPALRALLSNKLGDSWPDVDEDGNTTVKDVLDALLCHLASTDIPLSKEDPNLCHTLQPASVVTVHDALNVLCREGGNGDNGTGGCAQTVGEGGIFESLDEAIGSLQQERVISVCLLPGEHQLARPIENQNLRTIKISGSGTAASVVRLKGNYRLPAEEVILRDLSLVAPEGGSLRLQLSRLDVRGCRFQRDNSPEVTQPFIQIVSQRTAQISWHNNHVVATLVTGLVSDSSELFVPSSRVLGSTHRVRRGLRTLFSLNPGLEAEAYDRALGTAANGIAGLSAQRKRRWVSEAPTAAINALPNERSSYISVERSEDAVGMTPGVSPLSLTRAEVGPRDAAQGFYEVMGAPRASVGDIRAALDNVVRANTQTGFDDGLGLFGNQVGGVITDSVFNADIVLNAGLEEGIILQRTHLPRDAGNLAMPGLNLRLSGNHFNRVLSLIPRSALDPNGQLQAPVPGYRSLQVSENVFTDIASGFISTATNMQGNHFDIDREKVPIVLLVGQFGTFTGNWASNPAEIANTITDPDNKSSNGNLQVIVG